MAKTAQGTVGITVPGTQPMVAHCNEQVEAPYEDGGKTRLDELKRGPWRPFYGGFAG